MHHFPKFFPNSESILEGKTSYYSGWFPSTPDGPCYRLIHESASYSAKPFLALHVSWEAPNSDASVLRWSSSSLLERLLSPSANSLWSIPFIFFFSRLSWICVRIRGNVASLPVPAPLTLTPALGPASTWKWRTSVVPVSSSSCFACQAPHIDTEAGHVQYALKK